MAAACILCAILLVACSGGGEQQAAQAGKSLFEQATIGNTAGCKTCHSLEADAIIVGPSLAGISARAGSTVPGLSAEDYLRQSILEPDAYVVENFPASVMPKVWSTELSEEQIDQLVAYLLTIP
jgi:nitric oxide reductase subunit C